VLPNQMVKQWKRLPDLLEVIRALAKQHGSSIEEVDVIRIEKAEKRGGFQEKVSLIEVED
jgi:predicted house-cleaning noncanonical NTP pyrophosphatase (MazG superfamily)